MLRFLPAIAAALLAGLLLLSPAAASDAHLLDDYRRASGAFGLVYHRGLAPSDEPAVIARVGWHLRRLEERLDRRLEQSFTLVLAPGAAEFNRLAAALSGSTPPPWVSGMAFPGRGWILVRNDGRWAGGAPARAAPDHEAENTLVHELAHLFIHRRTEASVPRWFDEGVSMWASDSRLPVEEEAYISGLARLGGLYSFKELEEKFPGLHNPATVAYEESLMLLEFLVSRYGASAPARILDGLESGLPFSGAFREACGETWSSQEAPFFASLEARHSLLEVLALTLRPWTVITLLAILAMALSAWRRRKIRRRFEEEERAADAASSNAGAARNSFGEGAEEIL